MNPDGFLAEFLRVVALFGFIASVTGGVLLVTFLGYYGSITLLWTIALSVLVFFWFCAGTAFIARTVLGP